MTRDQNIDEITLPQVFYTVDERHMLTQKQADELNQLFGLAKNSKQNEHFLMKKNENEK